MKVNWTREAKVRDMSEKQIEYWRLVVSIMTRLSRLAYDQGWASVALGFDMIGVDIRERINLEEAKQMSEVN